MTFFEHRIDRRETTTTVWHAISAWIIIGVLVFANMVGLFLDRAATITP